MSRRAGALAVVGLVGALLAGGCGGSSHASAPRTASGASLTLPAAWHRRTLDDLRTSLASQPSSAPLDDLRHQLDAGQVADFASETRGAYNATAVLVEVPLRGQVTAMAVHLADLDADLGRVRHSVVATAHVPCGDGIMSTDVVIPTRGPATEHRVWFVQRGQRVVQLETAFPARDAAFLVDDTDALAQGLTCD